MIAAPAESTSTVASAALDGRRRGPGTGLLVVLALAIALIAGSLGGAPRAARCRPAARVLWPGNLRRRQPRRGPARCDRPCAGQRRGCLGQGVAQRRVHRGQRRRAAGHRVGLRARARTGSSSPTTTWSRRRADGGDIEVAFADGERVPATIVGRDASYDLAVLRVDARTSRRCQLGSSDERAGRRPGDRHRLAARAGRHRHRRASSAPRTGRSPPGRAATTPRTSPPSRPTPPSTRATPAARWSTSPARSSASTPRSRLWVPASSGQSGSIGLGFAIPIDHGPAHRRAAHPGRRRGSPGRSGPASILATPARAPRSPRPRRGRDAAAHAGRPGRAGRRRGPVTSSWPWTTGRCRATRS